MTSSTTHLNTIPHLLLLLFVFYQMSASKSYHLQFIFSQHSFLQIYIIWHSMQRSGESDESTNTVIIKITKDDFNATRQNYVAYWSSSGSQKSISRLTIHQNDLRTYIWGSEFSCSKAYRHMKGHFDVHNAYKWIWKSWCQLKHKIFFWLLLKDRLNTRDILRRRNMHLVKIIPVLSVKQALWKL